MRMATATMSMYGELLAMSLDQEDDTSEAADWSEKRLLQELAECRDRLRTDQAIAPSRRPDAPSRVATELRYDRALINLCRLHEIACGAARFTCPQEERRRLEEALRAAGVDVRAARHGNVRRGATGGAHEPPVGS
jgi:predicted neuraminidase